MSSTALNVLEGMYRRDVIATAISTIKVKMAMESKDKCHLGQLDVSVDEIREVWEIEAKGELLVSPARLVKVRS